MNKIVKSSGALYNFDWIVEWKNKTFGSATTQKTYYEDEFCKIH